MDLGRNSTECQPKDEEEDNYPVPPPPSNAEIVNVLDTLRRRIYHKGLNSEPLSQLENILTKDMIDKNSQKKINDYFKL